MGSVADKIARTVATQIRSNVIDLSAFRAGRERAVEAGLDGSRSKDLVEQGYDPVFAFYVQGLTLVSMFAEAISAMPEAKGYAKAVAKAEDECVPDGPPISPLTASCFNMWAFFDLQFGSSRETMGACILRLAETTGMPAWIADIVRPMRETRMGVYVHMGLDGPLVLLKDIVTRQILRCHSATGYLGETGQLWYTGLLPHRSARPRPSIRIRRTTMTKRADPAALIREQRARHSWRAADIGGVLFNKAALWHMEASPPGRQRLFKASGGRKLRSLKGTDATRPMPWNCTVVIALHETPHHLGRFLCRINVLGVIGGAEEDHGVARGGWVGNIVCYRPWTVECTLRTRRSMVVGCKHQHLVTTGPMDRSPAVVHQSDRLLDH